MREIKITEKEAGQRLDRYLQKYLPLAPKSFFYKMLRKKNITCNGKKAEGSQKLEEGDLLKLFFAEETLASFSSAKPETVPPQRLSLIHILKELLGSEYPAYEASLSDPVCSGLRINRLKSVSYTHLDVYKRQIKRSWRNCCGNCV